MVADPKDRNTFFLETLGEMAADGSHGHFFPHETDRFHFPTDICHSNREEIAVLLVVEMKDSRDYFIFLCSQAQAQK